VASLEVGQAFDLATRWRMEPQFQLAYQRVSLKDVMIPGARVAQHIGGGWIARLGARVRGGMGTPAGFLQPYGRVNLYAAGAGTDVAEFVADGGASTGIASATRHHTAELAVGLTLSMTHAVSIYGELGSLHALGGPASVKSSIQGSVGLRADW
jgi:outer membrane autotransporter protein